MKIEKASSFTVSALPSQQKRWRRAAKKSGKLFSRWVANTLDSATEPQATAANEVTP